MRDQFVALVSESTRLSDELQVLAMNVEEPSCLADLVASNLELDVAGKQAFLEELDVVARLRHARDELRRANEAVKIESEIREKVQSEIGRTQRDYMLRQQLEHIRRELGEARGRRDRGRAAARAHRGGRSARGRARRRPSASSSASSRRRPPPPSTA